MRKAIVTLVSMFLLAVTAGPARGGTPTSGAASSPEVRPGDPSRELIVLLARGRDVPGPEEVVARVRLRQALPATLGFGTPDGAHLLIPERDRLLDPDLDPDSPAGLLNRYIVLSYPLLVDTAALVRSLARNPNVLYVGANRWIDLSAVPNDPLFPAPPGNPTPDQYQWGSNSLHLPEAWDYNKGHSYIGVIDVGLATQHPDLRSFHKDAGAQWVFDHGNYRPQLAFDYGYPAESPNCPGDPNVSPTCVDEPQIEHVIVPANPPNCPETPIERGVSLVGHGTHVAGIIAATANNSTDVAGACWNCSLLVNKVSDIRCEFNSACNIFCDEHRTPEDIVVAGVNGAIAHGAQVLNLSLGFRTPDCSIMPGQPLCPALQLAEDRDVVVVAAAGNQTSNDYSGKPDLPANDARVIGVAGIDSTGNIWNDCDITPIECASNYSSEMIDAPAKQILSTFYPGIPWGGSTCLGNAEVGPCTGTSMASPYIAGSVGILRSVNPLLSKANIKTLLTTNLENPPGWNPANGKGKPNLGAAVRAAQGSAQGAVIPNRLTPLFSLYSANVEDFRYTTAPQMAASARFDVAGYDTTGPLVNGYPNFPGVPVLFPGVGVPSASVYIFTGDRAPYSGAPLLVPLYRLSLKGTNPNGNANHQDTSYTTTDAGVLTFKQLGYELDGIEGYIYARCTPDCIPSGAVRLYRRSNYQRGDFAIFPESELASMESQGYTSTGGSNFNEVIGYVYPNIDSDLDNLIDGFEGLLGTDPQKPDSDCDGIQDGVEVLGFPASDPLVIRSKYAQILNLSVPTSMTAGQNYPVSVTLKNAGCETWSPVGPQCNAYRWGSLNNCWNPTRAELPGAVASGGQVTLNYTVTAPTALGPCAFQWRMVHECVEWFGDATNVAVNVVPPPVVANFSFVCTALSCSFNGAGSTGTGLTYAWSFGDSASGSGVNTSHPYLVTGAYTATLTVTDGYGQQSSKSKKVSVTDEIPVAAESFFTVPPCRIADTRNTTPLTSGVQRLFQVSGLCGIPASAKAAAFNVTVISPTGPGHLLVFPGNQTSGPFAHATINFDPANSPRANNANLRLATNGAGSVNIHPYVAASPGEVHAILDVYGYFSEDTTPAPGAQGPLGFQTITPCRIADTRTGTPIAVNTTRNFTVQGVCGVPVGASAAPLNLVIISPTAGGHAPLFQAGVPPGVPTINFNAGVVLANGARIRLAPTTPDISLNYYSPIAGASTHALIDVYGYFKSDALLKYRPITACRAVDTRFADQGGPALGAPDTRNFQIRGNCGVPTSAKAVAVNITTLGSTGPGHLIVYPSGGAAPAASYLNFDPSQGALGNGGIVALSTLSNDLAVTSANSTHVIIDVFGYFQ